MSADKDARGGTGIDPRETLAPLPSGEGAWSVLGELSSPEAFCRRWLGLECTLVRGVARAVVVLGPDGGPYAPMAFWPEGRRDIGALAEIAERAAKERRMIVVAPPAPRDAVAPPPRPLMALPIVVAGKLHGVVALDLAPRDERELELAARQLQAGAGWMEALVLHDEAQKRSSVGRRLEMLLDLTAIALGRRRFEAAATAFATAVATNLGCDRVTIGFVAGGRARVRAVSHSAEFRKQANLVRSIAAAMDEALDQRAVVVFPPSPEQATRVMRAHAELSRREGAGAICSVPIRDTGEIVGVLTLERPLDRPFEAGTVELCEALAAVAGPILELQRRDDRWLAAKALDSARNAAGRVLGAGHVGAKLAVIGLAAAAIFLATAKGEYRVSATSVLEPMVKRAAVAPFQGYIAAAPIRAGDLVHRGQVLCVLDDRDLRIERSKWLSQEDQLQKQYNQAVAARSAAQSVILTTQIDQAKAEVALIDEKLARTRVVAPFDGIVVTGDLSHSLGAPIDQGQVLFEVAPLDAYRLALQVDERDVADVMPHQRGRLVLAGLPAQPIGFEVVKITPVSASKEGHNYFRAEARLERTPPELRPGMEGVGKVEVDRRRLIHIWTRQLLDWARLTAWKWTP